MYNHVEHNQHQPLAKSILNVHEGSWKPATRSLAQNGRLIIDWSGVRVTEGPPLLPAG